MPQASDSRSTFGSPSDRLGSTVKSAARYQSGSSSWSFGPTNVIVRGEAVGLGLGHQIPPQRPIPHEVKVILDAAFPQQSAGFQQDIEPLDRDHPADPNDDTAWDGDPKLLPRKVPVP